MIRQQRCRSLADKSDTQSEDQAVESALATLRDFAEKVPRGFLSHALERDELFFAELVKVGETLDHRAIDQLLDQRVAQSVDVHRPAPGKVQDRLLQASRTI